MPATTETPRRRTPAISPRTTHRHGKACIILAAGIAAVLCALAILLASRGGTRSASASATPISPESMSTVVTVDGLAEPVREFELFLAQERANTFAYFQQHYNDGDGPGFWTTPYGGQAPASYLEKLALTDAVTAAVQSNLAHEYGLVPDPSYAAFLKALASDNAQRAADLADHLPIYGPQQYSESDYFTYIQSQMGISLVPVLIQHGVIPLTDNTLEQYYSAHRGDYQQSGVTTFAMAKGEVQQDYERTSYAALLARLSKAADVEVDQRVLAAIAIN